MMFSNALRRLRKAPLFGVVLFVLYLMLMAFLASLGLSMMGIALTNVSIAAFCLFLFRGDFDLGSVVFPNYFSVGFLCLLLWLAVSETAGVFYRYGLATLLHVDNFLFYVVCSVIFAPLGEEFLFRGVLFRLFRNRYSFAVGTFVSTVLFAVSHGAVLQIYVGVVLGLCLCVLYEATGRLFLCVLFHACYNLLSMAPFCGVSGGNVFLAVILNGCLFLFFICLFLKASRYNHNRKEIDTYEKRC